MAREGAGIAAPWTSSEPGWRDLGAEVRRMAERNRARPWAVIVIALLATAWGLFQGYRHQPSYEARVALRLTENDIEARVVPRPVSELRAWVFDVALSDGHLIKVLDRFKLYERVRQRGLDQALEALRDDIEVEVWRNEFLLGEEAPDLFGRSARVALTYKNADPDLAFGVVQALAEATVAEQRRMRQAQAAYLSMGLDPAIQAAREQLLGLKLLKTRSGPEAAALSRALASGARDDVEFWEKRVSELTEQRQEAHLRLQAETLDLGLQSEIIDSLHPRARPFRLRSMSTYAIIGLLCGLLLGGVTIKAFDRRIYDEGDLRRLGFHVVGALPAYPGDDVGSMKSRVRMTMR